MLCSSIPPHLIYAYLEANLFQLQPYINDMRCLLKLQVLYINGFDSYWTPPLRAPSSKGLQSNTAAKCPGNPEGYETRPETRLPGLENVRDVHLNKDEDEKQFYPPPSLRILRSEHFGLFYKLKKIRINPNNSLEKMYLSENHFPV